MPTSPLLNVMTSAARRAGRGLARDYGEVSQLQVSIKGPANFVSAADHRAEETIYNELAKARPGYGFLMEERGIVEGADKTHRWIVDPLDGTTNFLHSIPLFAISIALEREGSLVAGLVYNPISDEMFTAERGKGAFLNDRRLRVSARRALSDAVVTTGIPHRGRPNHGRALKEIEQAMTHTSGIRRTGSAALDLAWTAAGRFDAFWEHALGAWDIAAGVVLIRESGGLITDLSGGNRLLETGDVLAATPTIHRELLAVLKAIP